MDPRTMTPDEIDSELRVLDALDNNKTDEHYARITALVDELMTRGLL